MAKSNEVVKAEAGDVVNPRFGLFRKLGGVALAMIALVASAAATGKREVSREVAGNPLRVLVHVNFADAGRQANGLKNVENMLSKP